jgi:N utilization substance protein B
MAHQEFIDRSIQSVSERWRLSRMPVVDRNILRMAVFELLYEEDVEPAIVINEAIEIAKKYSGEQAAVFINGVLDALRKRASDIKKSLRDKEND